MDHDVELQTGLRIDAALRNIQAKVCLTGMAGRWHVRKACSIIETPDLLERSVVELEEREQAIYVDRLPALIAKTEHQDALCQAVWHSCNELGNRSRFLDERRVLLSLYRSFQFQLKTYERVVRQPEKPLLTEANDLIEAKLEKSPQARRLEAIARMRLPEFVALENGIAHDLRNLDVARGELSLAFQWLAQEIAEEQQGEDQKTLASATIGLRRATGWYDHKRGYPFAEYARWWILEAIEKHRE